MSGGDGPLIRLMPVVAPWLGVLAAGAVGTVLGVLHAVICNRPRVNYVAVGIAMMIFGIGLAAFLGTPFIKPRAPKLPDIPFDALFGFLSHLERPGASGVPRQRPVPCGGSAGAGAGVDAAQHALGADAASGRRE